MTLKNIRALMRRKKFQTAFSQVEKALKHYKECPNLWNIRGDLIQLIEAKDAPPLSEAAKSYRRALKLNPNCLESIESLAHYYDAVDPQPAKARYYANVYVKKAEDILYQMKKILADTSK